MFAKLTAVPILIGCLGILWIQVQPLVRFISSI